MLTAAGTDIPIRVQSELKSDETAISTLSGLRASGMLLTNRRLFAWRENGSGSPLPLRAVAAIVVDADPDGDYHHVIALPRQPLHAALVLARRRRELNETLAFLAELEAAVGLPATQMRLGSLHRVAFANPLAD